MSSTPLRIVRVISASAEEIFDAWTDAASLAAWMAPGSVRRSLVDVDPRVGGRFRILMQGPDCDHEHTGEYLVLDRPRRLVFTWTSAATRGRPTRVSVELEPRGPHETELTLVHEGLLDEPAGEQHRAGWGDILLKLAESVSEPRGRGSENRTVTRGGRVTNESSGLEDHPVVTRDAWLAARAALLAKEKEFTRLRDELSRQRRELPWVRLDKPYVFEGPEGKETLAELFARRSQLVVYHFMFSPDWDEGCPHCSFWADSVNGMDVHLRHRDVSFVAVSRAPLAKIEAFKKRMGWSFRWLSSLGSDFNHDLGVSFTAEELEAGPVFYNYAREKMDLEDREGVSVFYKGQGAVFHTYSAYARGIDLLNTAYNFLDLVPKGRDEERLEFTQAWVRHHDRYED